jgi:opacity protein-like surface antigen
VFTVTSSIRTDWLAALRGRLGVAHNNWLFYVTGGAAFTKLKGDFTFTDNCGDVAACSGPGGPNGEYLYTDFGSVTGVGFISTPGIIGFGSNNNPFTHSADLRSHIVRLGLNYRLN